MPTYSYACDACGKSFEKEQRIVEDALKVCELCGEPKARRLITSGNFILKGGGWYSDLYSSSKSGGSNGSSNTSSASTSTSSESGAKSDTGAKATAGAAKAEAAE